MTFTRFAMLPGLLLGIISGFTAYLGPTEPTSTSKLPTASHVSQPAALDHDAKAAADIRIAPTQLLFDCGSKKAGFTSPSVSLFASSTMKSSGPSAPVTIQTDPAALRAASLLKSAVLTEIPLADGSTDDFIVNQFDVFTPGAKVVAFDGETETPLALPEASCFDGYSVNDPDTHIFLTIVEERDVWMMISSPLTGTTALGPDITQGKSTGEHVAVRVEDFGSSGFQCFADALSANAAKMSVFTELPGVSGEKSTELLDAEVLVDVSNGLYKNRFGSSSNSATTYVSNLFGAVSSIYRRDVNINLRIKQLVVWTSADPFNGNSSDEQLDKYELYNNNNRSGVQRDLCHLLADENTFGGIAYLDVLCDTEFGYAVSNIDTGYSFPPVGYVWDVDVVAHETGHNFGSPHTHCYSPPIDCCFKQAGCDGCPNAVPQVGTIMSYCHLTQYLSQLRFDTRVQTLMRQRAEASACITPALSGNEFIIYNDGSALLEVTSMAPTASAPWLSLSPATPIRIGTGAIQIVEVNINCGLIGVNGATANVRVLSNDPDESPYPGDVQISVLGDCFISLSPTEKSFTTAGGTGSVNVTAECEWTAASDQNWVQITSGSSGDGNGTINYSVAANSTTSTRVAHITVPGSTEVHTITQDGVPCTYNIAATSPTQHPSSGGSGTISVTTLAGCNWTPQSDKTWVTFPSGSGVGNGTINYDVNSNGSLSPRTATITVPGAPEQIVITQSGVTCTYQFSSSIVNFSDTGGTGSVTVLSPSPCFWSVASDQSWVQITSNSSGNGSKSVGYEVQSNETNAQRTAHITIQGTTSVFTIVQAPVNCTYKFSPANAIATSDGGPGSVTLDTQAPCNWVAVSDQPWLRVTSTDSGTGDATINYTVDPSSAPALRTGHIAVGDATFTVAQEGLSCNFQMWPPAANYGYNGGAGTVSLQGLTICEWTAEADANWITITSGESGTGPGSIAYSLTPNFSITSRSAKITIPGTNISHTITQGGSNCLEGVKSPDGGESWKQAAKRKVTWEQGCLQCSEVVIELWHNDKKVKTLKKASPNDGRQRVKMKAGVTPKSGYKIRIRCASDASKFIESEAGFTVTAR